MTAAGVQINDVDDKKAFVAAVNPVWTKYGAQHQALIQRIQDVK
jgi:TRAP-type C4-dicarboxylate transport system substrate-binding protein